MVTQIFAETWESGAPGAACTSSNTGFASTSNFTFAATAVAPGTGQSGHCTITSTNAASLRNITTTPIVHAVIPLRAVTAPSADESLCIALASGVKQAELQITTDLRVKLRNAGSTQIAVSAANLIPTGSTSTADCRIEWTVDTTADTQQVRVFLNPTSETADYDSGVVATTAMSSVTALNYTASAATWECYLGDLSAYSDGFPTYGTATGLYRDSAEAVVYGLPTSISVTIPATAQVGDLAVLRFVGGDDTWTITGPAGWTQIASQGKTGICMNLWSKTIASGDPGATVTVTSNNSSGFKRILQVAVFTGAVLGDVASATESVAGTSHTTPAVTAVSASAWVMVGVADRASPGSQAWTVPSALTVRQESIGTGGGAPSAVLATAASVGSGTVGVYTITGTVSTATAVMFSMVIEPSGTTVGNTVNAGQDVISEPRVTVTRTATATGSPTGWAWTQTAPASPVLALTGASTATVSFTTPPSIAETTFTLQATATYASGPAVSDSFNAIVLPVTKRFFAADGTEVPLRIERF